jgi:hypothetical protein
MENTRHEESLENSVDIEVKVDNVNLNDENITLKVTLRSRLFASLKTKLSFVYNKFMKLVSCSTNAVDTTYEPSTHEPRRHIEDLKNMKEPVIEKLEAAVETAILEELTVAIEQSQVVVEELVVQQLVEPVVVEEPVSIEERM